jgi:hypothetical protein
MVGIGVRIEDDILITTKGPQTFQQMHQMAGDQRINESTFKFLLFCLTGLMDFETEL